MKNGKCKDLKAHTELCYGLNYQSHEVCLSTWDWGGGYTLMNLYYKDKGMNYSRIITIT